MRARSFNREESAQRAFHDDKREMPTLEDVVHVHEIAARVAACLAPRDAVCLLVWAMERERHDGARHVTVHGELVREDEHDNDDMTEMVVRCAAVYGCHVALAHVVASRSLRRYVTETPAPLLSFQDTSVERVRLPSTVVYEAAKRGDQSTVLWLHGKVGYEPHVAMEHAARSGHLALVVKVGELADGGMTMNFITNHAGGEEVPDMVTWSRITRDDDGAVMCYKYLATQAHGIAPVQVVCGRADDIVYSGAMDFVASYGDLKLLVKMNEDPTYKWSRTFRAIELAASNGHMETLQWLVNSTNIPWSHRALDGAARSGHLAIIQWLMTHTKLEPDAKTFVAALKGGQIQVLQWLHDNVPDLWFTLPSRSKLVESACASSNRLTVLQWLEETKDIRFPTKLAVSRALSLGDIQTAQWLADPTGDGENLVHWDALVAKWLSYEFALWHTGTLAKAALNGHTEVVRWLALAPFHKVEGDTLWKCAQRGHMDIVAFIFEHPAHQPKELEFLPPEWTSFHDATDSPNRFEWNPLASEPRWARSYVELWLQHKPDVLKRVAWLPRWASACGYRHLVQQLSDE